MSALTSLETQALLRFHDQLATHWGLSATDAARMLGTDPDTLMSWHTGLVPVPDDAPARMGGLLGVYRELVCMWPGDEARGLAWALRANSELGGRSAVDVMMEDGLAGMLRVQGYLASVGNAVW